MPDPLDKFLANLQSALWWRKKVSAQKAEISKQVGYSKPAFVSYLEQELAQSETRYEEVKASLKSSFHALWDTP